MSVNSVDDVPKELLPEFPLFVAASLHNATSFLNIDSGQLNGKPIDAQTTMKCVVLDTGGNVTLFAAKKSFFSWEWTDAICLPQDQCKWEYKLDGAPDQIKFVIEFPASPGNTKSSAACTLSLFSCDVTLLPEFPATLKIEGREYPTSTTKLEIQSLANKDNTPISSDVSHVDGLLSVSDNEINVLSNSEKWCLPLEDYQGTMATVQNAQDSHQSQELEHIWWRREAETLISLRNISPEPSFLLKGKHLHREISARPIVTKVKGLVAGKLFHDSLCVCFPCNEYVEVFECEENASRLSNEVLTTEKKEQLVLIGEEQDTCVVIAGNSNDLVKQLELKPLSDFGSEMGFVAFLRTSGQEGLESDVEYPVVLAADRCVRSIVSPLPFTLDFVSLTREESGCYSASLENGGVSLRLARTDDADFRKATIHNEIVGQLSEEENQGMAFMYNALNDLRVRRFMRLLYSDVVQLYREMELDPSPASVLGKCDSGGKLDDATKEALIAKLLILAVAIPQLKRNLEQLGTFYPHQINQWDIRWLGDAFGNEVACKWSAQQKQRQTQKLRSFVRGAQSSLGRSLSEIERSLARLEPVYSETIRGAKKTSDMKQMLASGSGLAMGGIMLLTGGGFVMAGVGALNFANSTFSKISSDKQLMALLTDHGPEVLRWWRVFAEAFHVQVHESKIYLEEHFSELSKRDAGIFKQLLNESKTGFTEHFKSQLKQQILFESEQRFAPLWKGGEQIAQDLIELLDEIEDAGAIAIVDADQFTSHKITST